MAQPKETFRCLFLYRNIQPELPPPPWNQKLVLSAAGREGAVSDDKFLVHDYFNWPWYNLRVILGQYNTRIMIISGEVLFKETSL